MPAGSKMPKLTASAPILLTKDIVAAANYWRDHVGFSYERFWGEPPDFCILERDGLQLMLSQVHNPADVRPHWKIVDQMWNVYFWVDDVDAIYEELRQRGATIDYELHDKPYGCREFGIQDLDGHDIAFGQVLR
jgi:uncharacterized glyoxalase superfamily protein PhnB